VPELGVIIASVREGRAGLAIAEWFLDAARRHGGFNVHAIDLAEHRLPLLDEPRHPRLQQYARETTKAWGALIGRMDAFVFVTPEYNFGSPPSLINALDHVYVEWNYKPAGFVSYGGISGGLRSVQMTKQVVTTLKVVPLFEAVAIPFFSTFIDAETKKFNASEAHEKSANVMMDELSRWTKALASLRQP
jgi:NAD(P)H-dependent FMN reductase